MVRKCTLLTAMLFMSGCASTISSFQNDPLHHYVIGKKEKTSVYAMTGDRRTAIMFAPVVEGSPRYRFCAESLPDAVSVFTGSSKAKFNLTGKGEAEAGDQSAAAVLQTFHRTEMADIYRQMGWNACIAWAQGGITDEQYFTLLQLLTTEGMRAINTRAGQVPQIIQGPGGAIILSTPEASTYFPNGRPTTAPDTPGATPPNPSETPKPGT